MMETSRDTLNDSFTSHIHGLKRSRTSFCDILHSTVFMLVRDYFFGVLSQKNLLLVEQKCSSNTHIPVLIHMRYSAHSDHLTTHFWPPTDISPPGCAVSWDQMKLVPAVGHLKPLLPVCWGVTRSSANINFLLIPPWLSLGNGSTHERTQACDSGWPLLSGKSIGVPCWGCLNEMIITPQLALVTTICLSLPCP